MRYLLAAVPLLLFLATPLEAQNCSRVPEGERAAVKLAELDASPEKFRTYAMQGVDTQLESSPQMQHLRPAFVEFFEEYFPYDEMLCEYAGAYAELLSARELEGLLDFYDTELGRRLLEVRPELMTRTMAITQRLTEENQAALQSLIMQRSQEVADSLQAARKIDVQ